MSAAANDALLASVLAVVTDVAAGSDLLGSVTVNVPVVDVGQAADVLALAAELAVADSGAGVDVAVHFDSAVRIVQIVFVVLRRSLLFAWSARSLGFGWTMRTAGFVRTQRSETFGWTTRTVEFALNV